MQKISACKFKEQCLSILAKLGPEGVVITKGGKPVAKLLPISTGRSDLGCSDLIGSMKGQIEIHGDILSTGVEWTAES